jgi:hypothetical protein
MWRFGVGQQDLGDNVARRVNGDGFATQCDQKCHFVGFSLFLCRDFAVCSIETLPVLFDGILEKIRDEH